MYKKLRELAMQKLHMGQRRRNIVQSLLYCFMLFLFYLMDNDYSFVLIMILFHQIIFESSKHFFHHYFHLHLELELLFIGMIIGSYFFSLKIGLILAVLGTILFKGQIPMECRFDTFIHDIPNRMIIATLVFVLRDYLSLGILGAYATTGYYLLLHSWHELKHHHVPHFRVTHYPY